jgi:membrane-bound lytic murein transglycosylase A
MRQSKVLLNTFLIGLILFLGGCGSTKNRSFGGGSLIPKVEKTSFSALPGWQSDKGTPQAYAAFKKSCKVLLRKKSSQPLGLGTEARDWRPVCQEALRHTLQSPQGVRSFFEKHFIPYRVTDNGNPEGLFTGYYESSLKGSLKKTRKYRYPLYRKPPELVLSQGKKRTWGRLKWGRIVPYYDRAAIDNGALDGKGLELVWVDDHVETFFLHVQGSGRINLPNGKVMRVSYAASNGHPFVSIGRKLIENNVMDVKNISMQSIRKWMARCPRKGIKLMHKNPSYIFFREVKGADGPIGCMGVGVTAGRSMAIDKRWLPMGAPLWFDGYHPSNYINERRLMIAQDTGGAIKGVVRGDFFWGFGKKAMQKAGKMRSKGQYYILIPERASISRKYLLK